MKFGFVVDALGPSQLALELIYQINQAAKNVDDDIFIFQLHKSHIIKSPHCAIMGDREAWGFDGPLISTSISSTKLLNNCPISPKKYFYVYDLEWESQIYNVNELESVYLNPQLPLIARSKTHSKIIEDVWKRPIEIIEEFRYEQFIRLLSRNN